MIFGYARVSTPDQQLHLQTDALQAHGSVEVAQEKVSSVKERPAERAVEAGLFQSPSRQNTLPAAGQNRG